MTDQIETTSSWLFTKIFEACEGPWRDARQIPPVVEINNAAFPLNEDQQEHLRRVFMTPHLYEEMRKLSDEMSLQDMRQARRAAQREAEDRAYGVRLEVPTPLAEIMRSLLLSEPTLYARGRLEMLSPSAPPILAIIGSRQADETALRAARRAAIAAGKAGWTIMSGLAEGVDTAAHLAALDSRRPTIGVIGTPFTEFYPRANESTQRRIERDHLLLSPHNRRGAGGAHWFPARNKVMAYYADATLLIAATYKSGTRYQVEACMVLGRPVLALASISPFNWLQDANPRKISSPADLLHELEGIRRLRETNTLKILEA